MHLPVKFCFSKLVHWPDILVGPTQGYLLSGFSHPSTSNQSSVLSGYPLADVKLHLFMGRQKHLNLYQPHLPTGSHRAVLPTRWFSPFKIFVSNSRISFWVALLLWATWGKHKAQEKTEEWRYGLLLCLHLPIACFSPPWCFYNSIKSASAGP